MTTTETRSSIIMPLLSLALCAACMQPGGFDSHLEVADDDHDSPDVAIQELSGATGSCAVVNIPKVLRQYPGGYYGNMQYYSSGSPSNVGQWWNRQDCAAFVVDWERTSIAQRESEEAFVAGIIEGEATAEQCAYLWMSRKFMTMSWFQNQFTTFADGNYAPVHNGYHCAFDFNDIAWMGGTGPTNALWFGRQRIVRAAVQGFYWIYPTHVSSYMQTQNGGGAGPCPTQCCYPVGDTSACY